MLVHNVLFWLKKDLPDADRSAFRQGLQSLAGIPTVRQLFIGAPADTPARPVIDTTYDFMLTVLFDSLDDHNTYQDHRLHRAFVADHADKWLRVVVRDAE